MTDKPSIDLGALQAELAKATEAWRQAEKEASYARSRETSALNYMNQAQKALDAALAKLREEAPRGSDWSAPKGRMSVDVES